MAKEKKTEIKRPVEDISRKDLMDILEKILNELKLITSNTFPGH